MKDNFLLERFDQIQTEPTQTIIEDILSALRASLRSLAKLQIQEGFKFKSLKLNLRTQELSSVMARMILDLTQFKIKLEEKNG